MPGINDLWQSVRKLFSLETSVQRPFGAKNCQENGKKTGGTMSQISMIAMPAVSTSQPADQSISIIALFSCVGLLVSMGLIMFGVDLGSAWI